MSDTIQLSPFEEVITAYRDGRMVIIVDHVDRENEGDIAIATERLTPEAVAFMMQKARGLVCVSIGGETAERLQLPLQVLATSNNSPFHTPFAVSIDHTSVSSTGVTAAARCETMKRLLDDDAAPADFVTPGHVFPLIANPEGVIGRQGQTEGSYDLARIAGFKASGVICEILNEDGTVAKGDQINRFAAEHQMPVTSIQEIINYRVHKEILAREVATAPLETDYGNFEAHVFQDDVSGKEHLALVYGKRDWTKERALVRIHSECLTGDVFGSRRCDCGGQLSEAMRMIVKEGAGILLYLRQEGRGIGLANKLRAYQLQDVGHDTVEANLKLGFAADARDFAVAAKMLQHFGVKRVQLITNNPEKMTTLVRYGLEVLDRVPLIVPHDEYSKSYIETKRTKMGHLF